MTICDCQLSPVYMQHRLGQHGNPWLSDLVLETLIDNIPHRNKDTDGKGRVQVIQTLMDIYQIKAANPNLGKEKKETKKKDITL
jgi:hypothetical protein